MAKVATITLNAAYDLVGRLPRIEIGEVNTVKHSVFSQQAKASMSLRC